MFPLQFISIKKLEIHTKPIKKTNENLLCYIFFEENNVENKHLSKILRKNRIFSCGISFDQS
ncbi:MAG: hypothetical protein CVV50_03665 [Spirochaetae bacterium HGW-Spirochaetae-6]|nr:MAG: hypothetical protein CVV50_03665 [Spirochaetae bacterium HGW-Spirochaetae-6]